MKEILETSQLEFDKSSFLIDLVRQDTGALYIEITQTILSGHKDGQSIKINPSVLSDILQILQTYQAKLPKQNPETQRYLTDNDQQKLTTYYLKGVSIKDLAMQFDQEEELIEMVIRNKGITIVDNEQPKTKRYRRKRRK
jgi:hypothetical protein